MLSALLMSLALVQSPETDEFYVITRSDGPNRIYTGEDWGRKVRPESFQFRKTEINYTDKYFRLTKPEAASFAPEGEKQDPVSVDVNYSSFVRLMEFNWNYLVSKLPKNEGEVSEPIELLHPTEIPEGLHDYKIVQVPEKIPGKKREYRYYAAKSLHVTTYLIAFRYAGRSERNRPLVQLLRLDPYAYAGIRDIGGRLDREGINDFTQLYGYVEFGNHYDD